MGENSYEIKLGIDLDTSNIKEQINKIDNKYDVKLGVDLKVNDIRDRIAQYNKNTNNAKLKLGVKLDTDDLKRQINSLNLGGTTNGKGVAIPVNTQSLETSLREVKGIISDIKTSIGSLDSGVGMKSLLSSINQISTALDKASGKFDELNAELKILSSKDFNINLGIDMGKKNLSTIGYGRAARKQVIPQLEEQAKYLEDLLGGQQAAMKKLTSKGKDVGFDIFADFNDFNSDSAIKKMEAMEKYVNSLKSLASIEGVKLDGFNEIHKNASELINDITGVENAVDQAGDIQEKLKNFFGGSIDGEALSGQLDSIVTDLNEIKSVIQGTFQGVTLEGLTSSFNKLSDSIELLVKNCTTAKQVVNDVIGGLDGSASKSDGGIENLNNDLKQITITANNTSDAIQNMKNVMSGMKFNDSSIDAVTKDLEEMNIVIKEVSAKQGKNLDITVKGINEAKEAVTVIKRLNDETGNFDIVNTKISKPFNEGAEAAKKFKKEAETVKNIKFDFEVGKYDDSLSKMDANFNQLSSASKELRESVEQVRKAYNELEAAYNGTGDEVADKERLIQAEKEYARALQATNNLIKIQARTEKFDADRLKLDDDIRLFQADIDKWLVNNSAATKRFGGTMLDLKSKAEGVDRVTLNGLIRQFKFADKQAEKFGLKTQSVVDKIKTKFKEYASYLSAAELFMYAEQAFRSMFEQVKLIDSAMTELKKVTNETDAVYSNFLSHASLKAEEIGTTIDGLVSSTADFARLGYNISEAQKLAEVANIYAVVGDEIDSVETATKSLISTMTAFGIEASDSMSIVDKFNIIGNNFAISSGGIGDALERSASSMAAANNTLDETIALITAANTVVQDADAVGTAFKTISMRIRGATTDLEEAGLDTEGMASSTAKLREEIMALSGVDIMLDSTTFKSTYKIMEELATKWQDLTDIQQASITELIAGKRQGNIVSSLMTNFDIAQSALQTSLDSSGSAMEEHEKAMDSIELKLNSLKAAWQSFSQTFLDSKFLKGGIDTLKVLVEMLESLIDNFGVFGTIGIGAGIFGFIKNFKEIKNIFSIFSAIPSELRSVKSLFGDLGRTIGKSFYGVASAVGIAAAAIGLIYNQYKKAKEEAAAARQEAIDTADAFLDSASSFEQAYIKYSDKTDLTSDEEAELKNAINGTIDALGDKASALQSVVNSNNDYLASLEAIKKAELDATKDAAEEKKKNAAESLKEAAIGWTDFDGSEVDVFLGQDKKAIEAANKLGSKYIEIITQFSRGYTAESATLKLSTDASIDELIEYYNFLVDYRSELDEGTDIYKNVDAAIKKMSDSISVYTEGVYEAVKANYQIDSGIPKTVEEYISMREAILSNNELNSFSIDKKMGILNALDSEYAQLFDLSSVEAQARKFVGIIEGYGDGTKDGINEIGTVETFLNMRTAVNNNECTVGQYLSELNNVTSMSEKFNEKEKEEFNLAFGIDTDSIKEQYKNVYNYISRNYLEKLDTSNMISFDAQEFKNHETQKIKDILNDLTARELNALVNIKGEINWETANTDEILSKIKEEAKIVDALNFEANIEADATSLEVLNEILAESASAMGLTSESIDSLKAKYANLDSYNPSALFEKTANGVKVNRRELERLEKKQNELTKSELKEHLNTLIDEYNNLTAEIDKSANASERAQLISEKETYANKIEELATYQAQLEGVTGAYQRWIDAQNEPEDYEGYEAVATSREDIKDEIDRGFIGKSSKEYIDLLSGKDLQGGTIDDYADAWEKLDDKVTGAGHSISDFFTVNDDGDITATGIDRFFKSLQTDFKGSVANFDKETKKWTYDFGVENLEKIQEEWGMGIEAIELLLEAAVSAGYDIDWGSILGDIDLDTSSFETLVSAAEAAQTALNKIDGFEDVSFNFTATGVEEAETEIEKARQTFSRFINEDGTVNVKADGAEEMQFILTTLIIQKQQLSTPAIMSVDASQLDESKSKIAEVINAAQTLQTAYENYEIAISTGVDVEQAKTDLNSAIGALEGTDVNVRADLKLPSNSELQSAAGELGSIKVGATLSETAVGDLSATIQNQCTPEVIAKVTGIDESAIQGGEGGRQIKYTPEHSAVDSYINGLQDINKKIIFTYTTEGTKPNPSNIERTITYTYETKGTAPSGKSPVAGTAHANGSSYGRAFARGNWGIKGNGIALGGELGQELVVRDGKFFTIGDEGAEFFRYKKNDIVFNASQTESLFKYGGIKGAKPRGEMLAGGSAFVDGSIPSSGKAFPWSATATESNFASKRNKPSSSSSSSGSSKSSEDTSSKKSNSSSDEADEFLETLDWIEVAIDRIERAISKLDQKANNVYKNWSIRNNALTNQIGKVVDEINLQQRAYDRYIQEANSVGLDESWQNKIRDGEINIEDITDEGLKEKIDEYQDWYEKALDCKDAIEELKETESSLYAQRVENAYAEYEGILGVIEHEKNMIEEYISQTEANAMLVSGNYYKVLMSSERENIEELENQREKMLEAFNTAMNSGTIDKYSESW